MLASEYVEHLDGSGYGQRLWKRKTSRSNSLIWPEDKPKWFAMTSLQLNVPIHARVLAGVEKMFNEL